MSATILILDDEPKLGDLLKRSLERSGYTAEVSRDPREALERLKAERFDVLLTDLRMPGLDGIEVLQRARKIDPQLEVILMTAFASVDTAREALKRGAVDYLVKPFSAEEQLKPLLERLLRGEAREEKRRPARIEKEDPGAAAPAAAPPPETIACTSPPMREIYRKIDKIARSNATVLLRGESGTGKEVLANWIQRASPRARKTYVKINCGALPETLLESELFGHVKGSFTGAHADRDGLFKTADGGTILLDEIGEISTALQVKLLRVLQSGEFNAVGDSRMQRVDVRIVAATNRPLEEMVKAGTFREDLYYRLNVVPIVLPPLRDRPEDIDPLIDSFARKFSGGRPVNFSPEARTALREYRWPGNIRELENAIEHALVLGEPERIVPEDLPAAIQEDRRQRSASASASAVGAATLEEIEKRCLLAALEKTNGNRTRASALLGITRRTLGYRLKKYGLDGGEDEA